MSQKSEIQHNVPKINTNCLSDLILDNMIAGNEYCSEHTAHLSSCSRCSSRLDELEKSFKESTPLVEQLLATSKTKMFSTHLKSKYSIQWLTRPQTVTAFSIMLCIVLFLVIKAFTDPNHTGTMIRTKGNNLRFFVQRNGEVSPGKSGNLFFNKDALRFIVSNSKPMYFFLIGLEQSGHVSAYYPFNGTLSKKLPPGIDIQLPGSLILDTSKLTEYFVGLFTSQQLSLREIQSAFDEIFRQNKSDFQSLQKVNLSGEHFWVVINKAK